MNRILDSRLVTILRWIARIWSLLIAFTVVLIAISPDEYGGAPVPSVEWTLLSMYAIAALGLLSAWRWEAFGGGLAVICMVVEILGFRLVKGFWYPTAFGFLVPLVGFCLPGVIFLFCWNTTRNKVQAKT